MDSQGLSVEKRRVFSFSILIKNSFVIAGALAIGVGLALLLYSPPVARADCMFDGSCNGNSGNIVPPSGLGPGTPGYTPYNPTPVCVENCGGASTTPQQTTTPRYRTTVPSAPSITPGQAAALGAAAGVGEAIGEGLVNLLFGDSPQDKAKALREQQMKELQKEQEIQQKKAAEAAAAAKAAEENRLREEAFQKSKSNLEQSLCGVQNQTLGGNGSARASSFPQIDAKTTEEFWKGTPDEPDTNAPCPPNDGRPHLTPNHFWDGIQNSLNQNSNKKRPTIGSNTVSKSASDSTNVVSPSQSSPANNGATPGQEGNSSDIRPSNAVRINGTTPMNLHQDDPGGFNAQTAKHLDNIQVPPPAPQKKSWYDKMNDELNQQPTGNGPPNPPNINATRG